MNDFQKDMKFEIGDIIIWEDYPDYCIRIIDDIDYFYKNYHVKTLKTNVPALNTNKLDYLYVHDHYRLLTPLEKLKYL